MLCECHGHIFMDGLDYRNVVAAHRKGPDESIVRAHLAACQAAGITYFRDGGDAWGVSLLAKRLAGEYGITYVTPAFAIHRRHRYGSIVGLGYDTIQEYRDLVAQAKAQGADFIKLMFSGILEVDEFGKLSCPSLDGAEISELVHIAHSEGFAVMAHVNGPEAVRAALEAGTDSIEHGYYMDDTCLQLLAQSKSIWVPTLAAIHAFATRPGCDRAVVEEILEVQYRNLRRAADGGAIIATGSDAGAVGVLHGKGILQEKQLLAEALGARARELTDRGNQILRERFCRCV